MRIEAIKPGDILRSWHDSGGMGREPVFFRALKAGRVKVRVHCELGDECWMYPAAFDKAMRPEEVDYVE